MVPNSKGDLFQLLEEREDGFIYTARHSVVKRKNQFSHTLLTILYVEKNYKINLISSLIKCALECHLFFLSTYNGCQK